MELKYHFCIFSESKWKKKFKQLHLMNFIELQLVAFIVFYAKKFIECWKRSSKKFKINQ
jgi:hypothetical protein